MYDFSHVDPLKLSDEVKSKTEEREQLKKRVNFTVDAMFERTQRWHEETIRKRDLLTLNKSKLEETIKELDLLKNKDLELTVLEVDRNLGDIFSVLLPGCKASLHKQYINQEDPS